MVHAVCAGKPSMDYDDKAFLDLLLIEYRSEETRRARRNLSVVAFIVIAAWLLDTPLTDVSAFGIHLAGKPALAVILIAGAMLVYWLVLFMVSWGHDREIQRERSAILSAKLKPDIDQVERLRKMKQEDPVKYERTAHIFSDRQQRVRAYERQKERTKRASLLAEIIRYAEIAVPIGLATGALVILACWGWASRLQS